MSTKGTVAGLALIAFTATAIAACGDDAALAEDKASSPPSGPTTNENGSSAGSGNADSGTAKPADEAGGGGAPEAGPSVPVSGEINCRTEGDDKTTLVFVNRCSRAVTFAGSNIQGTTLEPGTFSCVDVGTASAAINSKRYWGWVGTDPGPERHTLAEFTFNTDFNDFDWYNISHVDAHNLPMSIVPVGRPKCRTLSCPQDFLASCPEVGRVKDGNGATVSCFSPDRDDPTSPVALYFEACDDAYAWSGDDQKGTDPSPMRACAGEDWDIVFCPPPL